MLKQCLVLLCLLDILIMNAGSSNYSRSVLSTTKKDRDALQINVIKYSIPSPLEVNVFSLVESP